MSPSKCYRGAAADSCGHPPRPITPREVEDLRASGSRSCGGSRKLAEGAEHGPASVDQLDLAVPSKGLRIRGQAGRIPPVIARELSRQIRRGLRELACGAPSNGQAGRDHVFPTTACAGMCRQQTGGVERRTEEQWSVLAIPRVRCCPDGDLALQKDPTPASASSHRAHINAADSHPSAITARSPGISAHPGGADCSAASCQQGLAGKGRHREGRHRCDSHLIGKRENLRPLIGGLSGVLQRELGIDAWMQDSGVWQVRCTEDTSSNRPAGQAAIGLNERHRNCEGCTYLQRHHSKQLDTRH